MLVLAGLAQLLELLLESGVALVVLLLELEVGVVVLGYFGAESLELMDQLLVLCSGEVELLLEE